MCICSDDALWLSRVVCAEKPKGDFFSYSLKSERDNPKIKRDFQGTRVKFPPFNSNWLSRGGGGDAAYGSPSNRLFQEEPCNLIP